MHLKFSLIISTLCFCMSGSEAEELTAYCFQFTWLGPMQDDPEKINTNCTKLKQSPCFEPFIVTDDSTPPDLAYMWKEHKDEVTCPLRPGYVCIKHTVTYNDAVINSTHFCGKMIEDKTTAISSGCFSQELSGHTIESCACESESGTIPCNSAKIVQYSFMFIILIFIIQIL